MFGRKMTIVCISRVGFCAGVWLMLATLCYYVLKCFSGLICHFLGRN